MQIFNSYFDYNRFFKTIVYYSIQGPKPKFSIFAPTTSILDVSKKIVDIISYCFMPNHYHILLKQIQNGGISEFASKVSNSYTKYFNIKNGRVGPILQGDFKSVHIETTEQLIHVSRYIHLNPFVGHKTKNLEKYLWSSYLEYIEITKKSICSKAIVLDQFKSHHNYKRFVLDHTDYAKKLEQIKHLLLDFNE